MAINPPYRLDLLTNIVNVRWKSKDPPTKTPPGDGLPTPDPVPGYGHWKLVEWAVIPAATWGNSFPGTEQFTTGLTNYVTQTQLAIDVYNATVGYERLRGLSQGGMVLVSFEGGTVVSKVFFSLYRWDGDGQPTGPPPPPPPPP